jgi:hypothetical protein
MVLTPSPLPPVHTRNGSQLGGDAAVDGPYTPSHRRLLNRNAYSAGSAAPYRSFAGLQERDFDDSGAEDRHASVDVGSSPAPVPSRLRRWLGWRAAKPSFEDFDGSDAPTLKDKLAVARHQLLNSPRFMMAVAILTLLLLTAPLVHPEVALSRTYFFCELVLTLLFCAEVGIRLLLMRTGFWASPINVAEALMCTVCVLAFAAMCVLPPAKAKGEHVVVVGLRLLAQSMRGITYCHQRRVLGTGEERPMTLA